MFQGLCLDIDRMIDDDDFAFWFTEHWPFMRNNNGVALNK